MMLLDLLWNIVCSNFECCGLEQTIVHMSVHSTIFQNMSRCNGTHNLSYSRVVESSYEVILHLWWWHACYEVIPIIFYACLKMMSIKLLTI